MTIHFRIFGMMLALSGAGILHSQSPALFGCPAFPPDNVWNARIDGMPLAQASSSYINTIGSTKALRADFGAGLWNGGPIGIPYTSVPGTQPKVAVSFTYAGESDPGPYPIPPDAPIEGGAGSTGDRHVLVVDRDQCLLYELYSAYRNPDGSWRAGSGARFDLRSNALRPAGWTSADAAGLPMLSGLVRYDEVASGEIRHAIRFTAPQTAASYMWPARHKASSLTGSQYPPMGQRFRLKASFDISGFSAQVQVILTALQRYGMILADNGSSWFLSGAPDERWDNTQLSQLSRVHGSDFEAVDENSLKISPDSGQVPVQEFAVFLGQPVMIAGSTLTTNTVSIPTPAPSSGAVISLSSSNMAAASVPASVIIPANSVSATFPVTTSLVAVSTPVTITGFYLGDPATASLRVDPGALNAVSVSAATVTGPASLIGTVSLTGGILGGTSVNLTSSNPAIVSVPSTVSIVSGALSGTFPVTVKAVTVASSAVITASSGGITKTIKVSVNPPAGAVADKLKFQQGTNGYTGGQSVTITTRYGAWNGGNGVTFREVYEYPSITGEGAAALLRFDRLSIPAGKHVVSATLTVTATSWTLASLTTRYLKGVWDSAAASLGWVNSSSTSKWNIMGALGVGFDILVGGSTVALKATGEQTVSIPLDPAVVAGWLANPASNQGLRLSATGNVSIYSDRNLTLAKRPVLSITVQ